MKVINKTGNGLSHSMVINGNVERFYIPNGGILNVPEEIAQIWLNLTGVEKYIDQADLEKAEKEAKAKSEAEKKALEEKNKALLAQLEEMKKEKVEEKKTVKAKATTKKKK